MGPIVRVPYPSAPRDPRPRPASESVEWGWSLTGGGRGDWANQIFPFPEPQFPPLSREMHEEGTVGTAGHGGLLPRGPPNSGAKQHHDGHGASVIYGGW